jgi:hypothetical protein
MPETWGGRSSFDYSGSVESGIEIIFGKADWKAKVRVEGYRALRRHFMGRTVKLVLPEQSLLKVTLVNGFELT